MAGAGSITSYNIAPGQSQADVDLKKKIALQLMLQGSETAPVQHWTQALARAVQGGMGGYELYQADQEDQADREKARGIISALSGGATTPVPMPGNAPIDPTAARGTPANAVSSIESGGKYDALGPVTKSGDRAYGKYQVMGANIPQWTKQYTGQEMTPDQFLANPQAQDAVFKGQFGQYAQKYGNPEAAARAWFAGEGNMNNLNAKDQLGTTVGQYGNRVATALGGNAPVGAPVDQPRGGLGDDRRQQLINSLMQTRAGAAIGQQLFAKELEREAGRTRPLTESEKQTYPGAVAIEASGKPVFPPQGTNVTLNTEKKGQEALAAKAVDAYTTAQDASKDAQKRIATYDQMERAAQSFTPGASAEVKLAAKRWMKDAGMIKGEDVPDQEAFKMLQQQLQIHAQPKGQGAVSNFEREMFARAIPNMTMSPEGLKQAININRKLEQFDMNVAQIYRDSARKNGGIPNYLEVQDKIAGLGSPLSDAETMSIKKAGEGQQETTFQPAAPSREEIEKEMRRRGLLK